MARFTIGADDGGGFRGPFRHRVPVTTGDAMSEERDLRTARSSRGGVPRRAVDLAVIGGGPAGAAAAIRAARAGASVVVFEKGPHGRDKVCGDGLTPRAVAALEDLEIDLGDAHRIDGLRMIAGKQGRELAWPTTDRFPNHGAVWPRRRFDTHLIDVGPGRRRRRRFDSEALPVLDDGRVIGVAAGGATFDAPTDRPGSGRAGRGGQACSALSADPDEPFGLAIRTYADTPRHAERHLEACLSLRDEHGTPGARLRLDVPGRRRHGEHRRRRAQHDEGVQEAQPQHAARLSTPRSCSTTGHSARTSTSRGRGGCR